jgi:hypothetical protein
MSGYAFAVGLCAVLVLLVIGLLRTRRVREKYAGTWLLVATAVCVLGAFPSAVFWLADVLGVQTPVNLVFSASIAILLLVCIQLSVEISNLEEETRTIAEEVALLRLEVEQGRGTRHSPPVPGPGSAG